MKTLKIVLSGMAVLLMGGAFASGQVKYLDVQPTKTINCKAVVTQAAGSSKVDCRHNTHYGYIGQDGYVYNDVELNALVVDVYNVKGGGSFCSHRRVFLHNPPETFRRYVQLIDTNALEGLLGAEP